MKKKKVILIIFILLILVGLGVGGYFIYKNSHKETPVDNETSSEDKFQTIVSQDDSCIHYKFNFSDVMDETKEYKIKDYKIVFNIISEGISNFAFENEEEIETLAHEYDVYYLNDINAVIIVNYTDFATGMYFANNEGIVNLSNVVKGAYTFKNVAIKDNILTFDVERWSKEDYIVVTDKNVFSAYSDDYTQYVEANYPVELSYRYDLNNKDFAYEDFEITPVKTIEELYNEIKPEIEVNPEENAEETEADVEETVEENIQDYITEEVEASMSNEMKESMQKYLEESKNVQKDIEENN